MSVLSWIAWPVFAAKHELAVLTVSHLNKSSETRAITRIMGSLEWVAAPRAVFLVTEEAGTDRRLFLPLKNNLAPDRFGHAFRIEKGSSRTGSIRRPWCGITIRLRSPPTRPWRLQPRTRKRRPRLSIFCSRCSGTVLWIRLKPSVSAQKPDSLRRASARPARNWASKRPEGGLWSGRQVGVGAARRRSGNSPAKPVEFWSAAQSGLPMSPAASLPLCGMTPRLMNC